MNCFRIAVCEDNEPSRQFEVKLINEWASKSNLTICTDTYTSAENFLFESEDKLEYDLLILDIQMGKMNGVELAKILRGRGFDGSLIFLTGIKDFAIEGYEVGAVRYLLKPIKQDDFFKSLSIVYSDFEKREKEVFVLQIGTELSKIEYDKIIYVEARGHYVYLCGNNAGTGSKEHKFEKEWKASFNSVAPDFENHDFFGLRRGLLVNLEHIKRITRTDCVLDNGEAIPVARGKYQELNEAFINFYRRIAK